MKMVFVATEKERKFKMPKKYIEREVLIESIKNRFKKLIDEGYVYEEIVECNAEISRIIDAQPTADVVEVVRCKDCKYSSFIKSCSKYECSKGCGALKFSNDFCSLGKRGD